MDYLDFRFAAQDFGSALGCLFMLGVLSVMALFVLTLGAIAVGGALLLLIGALLLLACYLVIGNFALALIAAAPAAIWSATAVFGSVQQWLQAGEFQWFWQYSNGSQWLIATLGMTALFAIGRVVAFAAFPPIQRTSWYS